MLGTREGRLGGRALDAAPWCALVAAAFVLAHPYGGIVHDGILYFAQALARIRPEIYAPDIFFKWGSQDRYSVFSPIYSALLVQLGVSWTNIVLVALSQALFLGASYVFMRKLVEPPLRGFGLLLVACSSGVYGGYFIFRMAEPFVTPRPFVEAATLFAMALVCSGRRAAAITVLCVAALLHPLVALIGFVCVWVYLVAEDRRWAWAAAGAVPALGAGLAGVQPFAQLFRQFDADWLKSLVEQNQHIFLTEWTFYDWSLLACDGLLVVLALRITEGVTRKAIGSVLALAALGMAVTFIGGDLLHNVLLTNLQLWRGLWLLHWMSAAVLPLVAWRMWREGAVGQLIAALAVFVFVFRGLPSGLAAAAVLALLFHYRGRLELRPQLAVPAVIGLGAAGLANWLIALSLTRDVSLLSGTDPIREYIVRALGKPFPLLVIGAGIAFWLLRNPARWQKFAAACVLAATAVAFWDQRVPMSRYIESTDLGTHPFSKIVGPQEEVFWYGDVVAPWVLMQRRSYMSAAQKAGQMFNRETAIELLMRREALNIVEFQAELCLLVNAINKRKDACHPDLETITAACREAPGLDYVVLENKIGTEWVATWTPPVEIPFRRPHFYLYDCKKLVDS